MVAAAKSTAPQHGNAVRNRDLLEPALEKAPICEIFEAFRKTNTLKTLARGERIDLDLPQLYPLLKRHALQFTARSKGLISQIP